MRENMAVIGSGMAGLAAARILKDAGHDVTVFEAVDARGMDAHSRHVHGGLVDVPLRVMSPLAWRSVLALARHVGVGTFEVDTYAACSHLDGNTWFRSSRMPLTGWPMVGSWRFLNFRSARIALGFWQLSAALKTISDEQTTLGDFLAKNDFDPAFWRGLMLPLLMTICTCSEQHLLAWPAQPLLQLLDTIVHGATLRRLQGGTPALVKGLGQGVKFVSGSPVVSLRQNEDVVAVTNARGEGGFFQRVIVATAANQTDFLKTGPFARERAALSGIRFDRGELWVHGDRRFLPRRKRDWSALNYHMAPDFSAAMFTVLVNRVEPSLSTAPPVLQTWNPLFEPHPDTVISRTPLARAVVHGGTQKALATLQQLHAEPGRRVFFAGSWAFPGVPLLESAVRSSVAVTKHLNVSPVWLPAA